MQESDSEWDPVGSRVTLAYTAQLSAADEAANEPQ